MKKILLLALFTFCLARVQSQKTHVMKMNAGIVTNKLKESKDFYKNILNFVVAFENDFYLLMESPGGDRIAFLLPDHPSQKPIFQKSFNGKGMFLTIEIDNVDEEYKRIKTLGVKIEVELRSEPWGDRHFAFYDPNGVGIDIVKYTAPQQ